MRNLILATLLLFSGIQSCKKEPSATTITPPAPVTPEPPTPVEFIEKYSTTNQKTGWYQTNKLFFNTFFIDTDPAKVNNLYANNGQLGFNYIQNVQSYFSNRQGSFYGDINGDGKADLLNNYWAAPFGVNKAGYYVTWEHEKLGFTNPNIQVGLTAARKFIFNDYFKTGKTSLLIASSGADSPPFPGDSIQIIEFSPTLGMTPKNISSILGYYHTGASGDVDNDGDIDILMYSGGSQTKMGPVYLENVGNTFQYNANLITGLGYDFHNKNNYYTIELFDLNNDSLLDIIFGGGGQNGENPTRILWGSSSYRYNISNQTILPFETKYSSVLDMAFSDIDKDNDLDLILLYDISYQGFGIQLFENDNNIFKDVTNSKVDVSNVPKSLWFGWLRAKDIDKDGDIDLIGDGFGYVSNQPFDKQTTPKIIWKNNGKGNFKASISY